MRRLRREKHLVTFAIGSLSDKSYAAFLTPGLMLQMVLINLRNRPLNKTNIHSISESVLSLYHNLTTGSEEIPLIQCEKIFLSALIATPFPDIEEMENSTPSANALMPAGMMVPTPGFRSSIRNILFPVHPEKTDLAVLRADRRNCIRIMELEGTSVTRVISPVYRTDSREMSNRWRVSDYNAEGRILMSILCQFTDKTVRSAKTLRGGKRKDPEEDGRSSSSPAPARKCLRL